MRHPNPALGPAALAVVLACAGAPEADLSGLARSLDRVVTALRWSDPARVRPHLSPGARPAFDARYGARNPSFQILDVAVVGVEVEAGGDRASVLLDVAYVEAGSIVERRARLVQTWRQTPSGTWMLLRQEEEGMGGAGLLDFGEGAEPRADTSAGPR